MLLVWSAIYYLRITVMLGSAGSRLWKFLYCYTSDCQITLQLGDKLHCEKAPAFCGRPVELLIAFLSVSRFVWASCDPDSLVSGNDNSLRQVVQVGTRTSTTTHVRCLLKNNSNTLKLASPERHVPLASLTLIISSKLENGRKTLNLHPWYPWVPIAPCTQGWKL